MKKSKFSDAEIAAALKRVDDGMAVQLLCWDLGISMKTFNTWRCTHSQYAQSAAAEHETTLLMERLKILEAENVRLKKIQLEQYQKSKRLKDDPEKT